MGAMGVALGIMVGNLTLGKRKYADVEPDIKELIEKSQSLMDELKHLTDEDARVFDLYPGPMDYPGEQRKKKPPERLSWNMRCWKPVWFHCRLWKRRMSH